MYKARVPRLAGNDHTEVALRSACFSTTLKATSIEILWRRMKTIACTAPSAASISIAELMIASDNRSDRRFGGTEPVGECSLTILRLIVTMIVAS